MFKIGSFVVYVGTRNWGWVMYGIGWKTDWFVGVSMKQKES